MYSLSKKNAIKIKPMSLSELQIKEENIEELLRTNIDKNCEDQESMLIVGRQVRIESNARSDLTAIDKDGNIVLIEIKRDKKDIQNREKAFEFQAIWYAASYATIETLDDLFKNVYSSYIEKYRNEFELGSLTSYEFGMRKLKDFLEINAEGKSFNHKQRIILVASDFDEQTLSAVAWLNNNNVDISCYKLTLYRINDEIYFDVYKILPVDDYSSYYVNLINKGSIVKSAKTVLRREFYQKMIVC